MNLTSQRARRRLSATLAASVVASGLSVGLVGLVGPVAPARAAVPASQATSSTVTWLADELGDDNLLGTPASPDVTATLDLGLGLARTGADPALLARVRQGVDAALAGYLGEPGDRTRASRVAKAAGFYTAAGVDISLVGGEPSLLQRLEQVVRDTDGGLDSTYLDGANEVPYEDLFNQSAAVAALIGPDDNAGEPYSAEGQQALTYLLTYRCAGAGWGFHADGTDPASACTSDVDTTSLAIAALKPITGDERIAPAVAQAATWLKSQQGADGSFGKSDFLPYNSNSTGLAAVALAAAGETSAATKAAAWVRSHQLTGFACDRALQAETGAITYSDEALASDLADGLGSRSEITLATAQAFPALALAPAATGDLAVTAPRFVPAGSRVPLTVAGLAPGERGCVTLNGAASAVVGRTAPSTTLAVPAGTKGYTVAVQVPGDRALASVVALAPKTLPLIRRSATVARGGSQTVRVTGLVAGEKVTVRYGSTIVGTGTATSEGIYRVTFAVGRAAGAKSVVARGQFENRRGSIGFTVR